MAPARQPAVSRPSDPLPKVVLFDMDDTIFDHSLTCRAALGQLRRRDPRLRGRPLEQLWRRYNELLGSTHLAVMLGRRTSDDARAERFLLLTEWLGHAVDPGSANRMSLAYRDLYQQLRRAVPGAPDALRRLHGRAKIGIVTNNTVAEQTEKLAFLGLNPVVDLLVTSEEIGAAKPDPAIFRAALERAGARPDEAVMVGDSWSSDVEGAAAAGIRAVWFNRFRAARPSALDVSEFSTFRAPRRLERLLVPAGGPGAAS
ncbi:MAG: HAD family hydrolase [Thermoplasmata archaeon]